jgi:hypothetical protein
VSWEDIILTILGTILGGFIAGLSGIIVEWWRENKRLREKHFEDIKRKCLELILKQLYDLKSKFVFKKNRTKWNLCGIEVSIIRGPLIGKVPFQNIS